MTRTRLTTAIGLLAFLLSVAAPPHTSAQSGGFGPGARVLLDAHNCYPDGGQFADRLDRALATGLPVAIEQDLVLVPRPAQRRLPQHRLARRAVHRHRAVAGEPLLRAHPSAGRAGAARRQARDLAAHRPQPRSQDQRAGASRRHLGDARHLRGVADDGAARSPTARARPPLDVKPVLVLTGNPDAQQASFHDRVPVGGRLRLFGAIPVDVEAKVGKGKEAVPKLAGLAPAELIASGATNYRRWVNFPWAVVERGGQVAAGRVDAGRRGAARGARHAGPRARPVDPLLHAERPRRRRRRRLDGELQLRLAGRGRDALARRARRRRRLHRDRPVRSPRPRPGDEVGRAASRVRRQK